MLFKIGDGVNVRTKFHGWKAGTIVEKCEDSRGSSWVVTIPNHWTRQTLALEVDMRKMI